MKLLNKLLDAGIEKSEAKKEIDILLLEFKDDLNKIENIIEERVKTRRPLQYILGKACFMDFELIVNENIFIPRPETEILVDECCKGNPVCLPYTALDIGTGSGCIAIALARKMPGIHVTAIDINNEIINIAKENAKNCGVEKRITFNVCNVFSKDFEDLIKKNKFDFIISNPPYVIDGSQPELKHEPKIALTGNVENKNGLAYYKRIFELLCSSTWTDPPATVALEIDPCVVNGIKSILKKNKINNFRIMKDYNGLDRFLLIRQDL